MSEERKHIEVVAAIIKKDNTILATQRGYGDLKDGWEFPGGKVEKGEQSIQAIKRELFEETGGIPETIDYIAQYQVHTLDNAIFKKDVYIVRIKSIKEKSDYLETSGPLLFKHISDVPLDMQSYLIQDDAILKCVERMIDLGYDRD